MDKQRRNTKFKYSRRLLNLFVFAAIFVFSSSFLSAAGKLRYSEIKTFSIDPGADEEKYTATDILFTLTLPKVSSSEVQVNQPEMPNGIRFKAVRKSQFYEDDGGVIIDMWINFDEAGTFNLPKLPVSIYGYMYYIPFNPVVIEEHPQKILPRMIYRFEDGQEIVFTKNKIIKYPKIETVMGKELKFSVFMQHTVQIVSYEMLLPKNGIIHELKRYDIKNINPKGNHFSTDYISAGEYSWIPLGKGNQSFPVIQMMVTAYSGERVELVTPEIYVKVIENEVPLEKTTIDEEKYNYAFVELAEERSKADKIQLSKEDCHKIATLRMYERRSTPFGTVRQARRDFEKSVGINDADDEAMYFWPILFLSLGIAFLIVTVVLIILKKYRVSIFIDVFLIIFIILAIVFGVRLQKKTAVIFDGRLRNVPEEAVEAIPVVEEGYTVEILRQAGTWFFVQYGTANGWLKQENLIFIE